MALVRSIATIGGWTMVSRIFGFIRDIMIANLLGTGPVADALFVAFRFPNLFRQLFAEGAFNAAFVPQFARRLEAEGLRPAITFAEDVLAVLLAVLLPLVLAAQAATPVLMLVMAPGFVNDPPKFALAVELARLTFPYLLFMALVALAAGVLNSLERFAAAAAAPILLNVVLIVLMLFAVDRFETTGHLLSWGIAAAGATQFVFLAIACRQAGVVLHLPWPRLTPGVRRVLKLMVPGAIGAGIVQINMVIGLILASLLPTGAISYLYYADRVSQLPLGVIGVAIGIALLPLLSRQLRAGDTAGARDSQSRAIEVALLLTVPATAALVAVPGPIVTVLFQRGAFGVDASIATADALAALACGLPAYVLVKVLSPGFFARGDTATPVKVAAIAMVTNVVLAAALMQILAHVGIALATACSAWINAALLAILLRRHNDLVIDARLRDRLLRIVLSAVAMGLALWAAARGLDGPLSGTLPMRVATLAVLVTCSLVVYAALAHTMGAVRLGELRALLRTRT